MRNKQEVLTSSSALQSEGGFQPEIFAPDLQEGQIIRLDEGDSNGYGISELLILSEMREHDDYGGVVGFEVETIKQFCRPGNKRQLPRKANPNKAVLIPDETGRINTDKGVKVIFTPLHEKDPKEVYVNAMISIRNSSELNKALRKQARDERRRQKIEASFELSNLERRKQVGEMILNTLDLGLEKVLPESIHKKSKELATNLGKIIDRIVTLPERVFKEDK